MNTSPSTPSTFIVTSPQELIEILSAPAKENRRSPFVSLAISGPQVLVRPFRFAKLPIKEIKHRLQIEAVEFLSLPAGEIESDIQIAHEQGGEVAGIFVCAPRKLLQTYVSYLTKVKLMPTRITLYTLSLLETFFARRKQTPCLTVMPMWKRWSAKWL